MRTKPFLLWATLALLGITNLHAANWPAWRYDGNGISPELSAPIQWDRTNNVRWRTDLPEPGNSSPIVWDNSVFITQAIGERREVMAFDRRNGKVLWQAGTRYGRKERTHKTNPYAASTPVTDGSLVIAWFGSAGLMAWDMKGKELWQRDLGTQDHMWGYASSPMLHNDSCILYFGPGARNILMAVDKKTGRTLWEVELPENDPPVRYDGFAGKRGQPMGSFSSPLIVKAGDRTDVVLSIVGEMRGFDPATGKQRWKADGLNPLIYTSPMSGEGMIVAAGGFNGSTVAVKAGATGEAERLWYVQREQKQRLGNGVISKGHIYLCNIDGIAQCLELRSGKEKWNERLKPTGATGEVWGSLLLVGDNLYVVNRSGDTIVFKADPEKLEIVSTNPLKELSNSTPAVSGGELFIRTHNSLWCIADRRFAHAR